MAKAVKLSIFIFLLWWPLSYCLQVIHEGPLDGQWIKAEDISWNRDNWFTENYQKRKEDFINENFTGHATLVRVHNQVALWLFNKAQSRSTIVGREYYVFGQDYIDSWYGKDYIGMEKINENVNKLRVIRDSLKHFNTDLLIVIAPGKGSFYHEYFPFFTDGWKKTRTNYEEYCDALKNSGINTIDFNSYFLSMKNKSPYTLYTKTGIHWSYYGMTLCMDSLCRSIEKMRGIDMPDMHYKKLIQTDSVSDWDMDVEMGMNLLFEIKKPPMTYPVLDFISAGKTKPHTIVIGDSFFWTALLSGMAEKEFTDPQFWFYYSSINYTGGRKADEVAYVDVMKELKKQDVVILLCNDAKLSNLGWGFIDKAYNDLTRCVVYDSLYIGKIKKYESQIRADANWLEQVKQKAILNKLSLDSMIHRDAIYLIEHEKDK